MYGPPPGPPPDHAYYATNMNPYKFSNDDRPSPPPYVKGGEGVNMPQETNYSSVSSEAFS